MRRVCCARVGGLFPVALALAGLGWAVNARAATATLNPSADALLSAAHPADNYGAAGALALSGAGATNGEFQSVLKFDLSAAKSSFDATFGANQWSVQSVTLRL